MQSDAQLIEHFLDHREVTDLGGHDYSYKMKTPTKGGVEPSTDTVATAQ